MRGLPNIIAGIVREDPLHALEQAVVDACAEVDRSVASLMAALYEFEKEAGFNRVGYSSFSAWAGSERFPYDRSTALHLRRIYETFVVEGGLVAEKVARAGWSKVHRIEKLVRDGELSPATGLRLARNLSQMELDEEAKAISSGRRETAASAKLPLWDVKIEIIGESGVFDGIYIHRRIRESSAVRAAAKARTRYGQEDLFGLRLRDAKVEELEE